MAQNDYMLKIDGIEGESQDAKQKGAIELIAFSFGQSQAGSSAHDNGGTAGKVVMHDIAFTMKANKASPQLMLRCANGEPIPKAVLTCRKAGKTPQDFLKITLTNAIVSSYRSGGDLDDLIPIDHFTLNFQKVEYAYSEQQSTSGATGGWATTSWDVKKHQ